MFAPKERECAAAWAVSGLFAGNLGLVESLMTVRGGCDREVGGRICVTVF